MGKSVTPSFPINIDEFLDITICGSTITQILRHWNETLGIEEHVYENLVRVFYSNMDLSTTRQVKIITLLGGHLYYSQS